MITPTTTSFNDASMALTRAFENLKCQKLHESVSNYGKRKVRVVTCLERHDIREDERCKACVVRNKVNDAMRMLDEVTA